MLLMSLLADVLVRLRVQAELRDDRGDVPGWVLVTMMTAMLVAGLWTFFQDALETVFTAAMDTVMGG